MTAIVHSELTLVAARDLSPSVRELSFAPQDPALLSYVAGQWVNLSLETASGPQKRAYSLCSASTEQLQVAVTRVQDGEVSAALHALKLGDHVHGDGPHGLFTLEPPAHQPRVFVGAGTGLSPLRAMLQELDATSDRGPVAVLFGCRSEAHILWRAELEQWQLGQPGRALHITLSRADEDWSGRRGYVQRHLVNVVQGFAEPPQVFICGLSGMVKDVRTLLKTELGYDRRMIRSERYD